MTKPFKMNECPWIYIKETDQGTLFWCDKCGAIFNKNGDWSNNGPLIPTNIDSNTLYCPDRRLIP